MTKYELQTGINIVPIISVALIVVLILLIISPFLGESRIKVDLPQATTSKSKEEQKVTITFSKDNRIAVDEKEVSLKDLEGVLKERLGLNVNRFVVIKADKNGLYGEVEKVLDVVKECRPQRIAVATEQKIER